MDKNKTILWLLHFRVRIGEGPIAGCNGLDALKKLAQLCLAPLNPFFLHANPVFQRVYLKIVLVFLLLQPLVEKALLLSQDEHLVFQILIIDLLILEGKAIVSEKVGVTVGSW